MTAQPPADEASDDGLSPTGADGSSSTDRPSGAGIVQSSLIGTTAFAVTAVAAAVVPATDVAALVVALALFAGGTVVFAAALLRAISRSRLEDVTMSGVFFVEGAPKKVRRLLLGSLAVEVVVAFATAGARPNTSLAFGILAPVWGQGLAGLWGARHGSFKPRPARAQRRGPPGPTNGPAPDAKPAEDTSPS